MYFYAPHKKMIIILNTRYHISYIMLTITNDNSTYIGEVNDDNKYHGTGILIHKDVSGVVQTKYCGTFTNGQKHGHGIEYNYNYDNDNINYVNTYILYSGEWKHNNLIMGKISKYITDNNEIIYAIYSGGFNENRKYQYKGTIYNHNNNPKFVGTFTNGIKNGHGKEYYDDGKLHRICNFVDDKKNGRGTEYSYNGKIKFDGYFDNDMYSGKSKLFDDNGNIIYEGMFKDGLKSGYGIQYVLCNNKSVKRYDGEWKDNMYHGKGQYKDANYEYDGDFLNGKYHGFGKLMYCHTGYEYNGDFVNGLKNGKGHYEDDLIEYNGEWKHDKKHGYGVYKISKYIEIDNDTDNMYTEIFEGQMVDDMMNKGKYIDRHGNKYDGEFVDNKYHGYGTMIYIKNNKVYEGTWKNGMKNGKGKVYNNDNSCYEAIWEDDKIVTKSKKRIRDYIDTSTDKKKKIRIENEIYIIIPDEYKCPISLSIMKEPIICSDGHTYDKDSITQLFDKRPFPCSPKTREPLDKKIMIPNHNIRKMIEEFLGK